MMAFVLNVLLTCDVVISVIIRWTS